MNMGFPLPAQAKYRGPETPSYAFRTSPSTMPCIILARLAEPWVCGEVTQAPHWMKSWMSFSTFPSSIITFNHPTIFLFSRVKRRDRLCEWSTLSESVRDAILLKLQDGVKTAHWELSDLVFYSYSRRFSGRTFTEPRRSRSSCEIADGLFALLTSTANFSGRSDLYCLQGSQVFTSIEARTNPLASLIAPMDSEQEEIARTWWSQEVQDKLDNGGGQLESMQLQHFNFWCAAKMLITPYG